MVGVFAARAIYGTIMAPFQPNPSVTVVPRRPLFVAHPVYGRFINPGSYEITIKMPQVAAPYTFHVRTDEEGYRLTSDDPSRYESKPEIWIFGCSFTWGWALDNEDTYPWLLQERFPDYCVKNYAIAGAGNVQALLQLREFFKDPSRRPPVAAVFGYCLFHKERNVAAPSRLRLESSVADQLDIMHPRAWLDKGELKVELVSYNVEDSAVDPSPEEMDRVTQAIFKEIHDLCSDKGIALVLGVQHQKPIEDEVIKYCRKIGFTIADMTVKTESPEFNLLPYDRHPNAHANRIYADKLAPVLEKLLQND
jgi:hypothetical protein